MLAKAIRLLRQYSGLRSQEVASKLGLFQSQLSRIESGKQNLDMDMVHKIAEVYGMTSAELILFSEKLSKRKNLEKTISEKIIDIIKTI